MTGVSEFFLGVVTNIISSVIYDTSKVNSLPFFERRRVLRRIEDATAEVVEPLIPFLDKEGISEDKQRILIQICIDELQNLVANPEILLQGSLSGQKIFDDRYGQNNLPEAIIEEGLRDTYTLLFPRIATILCKIPEAVKNWESEAWSENYKRLDEIVNQMKVLFNAVDEMMNMTSRKADDAILLLRRAMAQKLRLELDLTGLRSDQPISGKFDDFFVHPEIRQFANSEEEMPKTLLSGDAAFDYFIKLYHRAILIGPPGAGKSTWTKWLQRETLSNRWDGLGIRVELRKINRGSLMSLHELISDAVGKHLSDEVSKERISEWIDGRKIVVVFDGFDEVRPIDRDTVLEWINDIGVVARNCTLLVSSRPLTTGHFDEIGDHWRKWSIEPFDESKITDYINRWYRYSSLLLDNDRNIDVNNLMNSWISDPTIQPLTGNPLLLSTLLMVHHLDGRLPTGRAQLYRRYVEGMLGLWDDRRQVVATHVMLSLEQKRQLMRSIALKMFISEQEQLDENIISDDLRGVVKELQISASTEEVLSILRERSGLLVGPGIYSFAHKTIAEYLVADAIVQGDHQNDSGVRIDRFFLFRNRNNDRWNTVSFLWGGLASVSDVEMFIEECLSSGNLDLGIGMLFDQYNRISSVIRRKLILIAISKDVKISSPITTSWICAGPEPGISVTIPDFPLSTIGHQVWFSKILEKAITDGTIAWSDYEFAKYDHKTLLWAIFATRIRNVDEWKLVLRTPCPDNNNREKWLYLVVDWFLGRKAIIEGSDLIGPINAFFEVFPEKRGEILFVLLSIIADIIWAWESHMPQEKHRLGINVEGLTNCMKAFCFVETVQFDKEMLYKTIKWSNGSVDDDGIDLLEYVSDNLKYLFEMGIMVNPEVERILLTIEKLLRIREVEA